jgi:hypothetical protein
MIAALMHVYRKQKQSSIHLNPFNPTKNYLMIFQPNRNFSWLAMHSGRILLGVDR